MGGEEQVGIGIFTKSTAEYTKRGKNFNNELDYVAANVLMALVADFMLVWLPAPTLSYACASFPPHHSTVMWLIRFFLPTTPLSCLPVLSSFPPPCSHV